jgi:hypothetical protein
MPSEIWCADALLATAGCVVLREVLQALADVLLPQGVHKQQLLQGGCWVAVSFTGHVNCTLVYSCNPSRHLWIAQAR